MPIIFARRLILKFTMGSIKIGTLLHTVCISRLYWAINMTNALRVFTYLFIIDTALRVRRVTKVGK